MKIFSDIQSTIGFTPLVRLNRIAKGSKAQILAKWRYGPEARCGPVRPSMHPLVNRPPAVGEQRAKTLVAGTRQARPPASRAMAPARAVFLLSSCTTMEVARVPKTFVAQILDQNLRFPPVGLPSRGRTRPRITTQQTHFSPLARRAGGALNGSVRVSRSCDWDAPVPGQDSARLYP